MRSPFVHLLLALGIAIAAIVGYSIGYSMISNKSTMTADLEKRIATATANLNSMSSARAMLGQIAGDEAKVQSYFVSEADVVGFINYLESHGAAQKATVDVLSVSSGGIPEQPTLLLSLTIEGTFDAVMRTVGVMEYAPYDVAISTFSVNQNAKNSWRADVTLTVGSIPVSTASTTAP